MKIPQWNSDEAETGLGHYELDARRLLSVLLPSGAID